MALVVIVRVVVVVVVVVVAALHFLRGARPARGRRRFVIVVFVRRPGGILVFVWWEGGWAKHASARKGTIARAERVSA